MVFVKRALCPGGASNFATFSANGLADYIKHCHSRTAPSPASTSRKELVISENQKSCFICQKSFSNKQLNLCKMSMVRWTVHVQNVVARLIITNSWLRHQPEMVTERLTFTNVCCVLLLSLPFVDVKCIVKRVTYHILLSVLFAILVTSHMCSCPPIWQLIYKMAGTPSSRQDAFIAKMVVRPSPSTSDNL